MKQTKPKVQKQTNKKIKPMTKTNKKKTRPQQLGSPIFLLQGILSLYMMFLKIIFLPKKMDKYNWEKYKQTIRAFMA